MFLKMLKQIVKARYVWKQASARISSENKEQLHIIISQKLIVAKYYANI